MTVSASAGVTADLRAVHCCLLSAVCFLPYLPPMLLPSDISTLLSSNPALALPAVFVGGVLTSLTPCIYPMIPITVSIVGGQTAGSGVGIAATQSRGRTLAL